MNTADSLREALPDDVIERAIRAACDVADWHWEPEYNGEHIIVPSPEHSMEPIVLAVIEAIGPTVAAQIDAAREQVAEQIARTLIDYAAKAASNRIGVDSQTREQFLNGKVTAFQTAADVARQHGKGDGDG